ncbi:MAG: hypothetical protein FJ348_01655 [Sphingomonadales bacterium]|nr:hypothetical protein [Sphingomonadales bacterium]
MNRLFCLFIFLVHFFLIDLFAQELYVFTEPASVMPTHSLTLRSRTHGMGANAMYDRFTFRNNLQLVAGLTGRWTMRVGGSWGNMQTYAVKPESIGFYSRYRLLSTDDIHRHFRLAAYIEGAYTAAPFRHDEVTLMGDKSGIEAGLIATCLSQRLALSVTGAHTQVLHGTRKNAALFDPARTFQTVQFSFSGGYLLFPREYKDYRQTNLNLYAELLSQRSLDNKRYYVDAAPALQLIFASRTKLNLGYRFELAGTMDRMANRSWLLTLETTWLGFFKRRA